MTGYIGGTTPMPDDVSPTILGSILVPLLPVHAGLAGSDEAVEGTLHRMVPGSHERPSSTECACGGTWDRWSGQCVNQGEGRGPVSSGDESSGNEPVRQQAQAITWINRGRHGCTGNTLTVPEGDVQRTTCSKCRLEYTQPRRTMFERASGDPARSVVEG